MMMLSYHQMRHLRWRHGGTCTPANQRSCSTTARRVEVQDGGSLAMSAFIRSTITESGTEAPTRSPSPVTSSYTGTLAPSHTQLGPVCASLACTSATEHRRCCIQLK